MKSVSSIWLRGGRRARHQQMRRGIQTGGDPLGGGQTADREQALGENVLVAKAALGDLHQRIRPALRRADEGCTRIGHEFEVRPRLGGAVPVVEREAEQVAREARADDLSATVA